MTRSDKISKLLEELRIAQEAGENMTEDAFHSAMKAVVDMRLASETELSRRFLVSIPTINRWQRVTAPVPTMRKSVLDGLIAVVQESAVV